MKFISESEPPSFLMAQLQGVGLGIPKLTEPNPTTNALKKARALYNGFYPTSAKNSVL
ncbi:hypothetical protein VN1210_05870 [Helicobacter pylori]|nr:hypothetical protein VN1210_05870 [Helicobacter pylori]